MNKLKLDLEEAKIRRQRIEELKSIAKDYLLHLEAGQIVNADKKNLVIDFSQEGFSLHHECSFEAMLELSDEYWESFFEEVLENFPIFINEREIRISLNIVEKKTEFPALELAQIMALINTRASGELN